MLIGDGVTPSNEGRGYVLRRLLRRIVRSARLLGVTEPVLPAFAEVVRDAMGPSYPELATDFERISAVMRAEEEAFLAHARHRLADLRHGRRRDQGGRRRRQLPGDQAFQLHDTYGFPIDLTLEMAAEAGLTVDEEGFRTLMAEQRARAKADAAAHKHGHADAAAYRAVLDAAGGTDVPRLHRPGRARRGSSGSSSTASACRPRARATGSRSCSTARPFYAEGGGQQADTGWIRGDGFVVDVADVQSPVAGLVVHRGRVRDGEVTRGRGASRPRSTRSAGRRSPGRTPPPTSCTPGMRKALGDSAAQAGLAQRARAAAVRLHLAGRGGARARCSPTSRTRSTTVLLGDHEVRAFVTDQDEARRLGAIALFGEKYGDQVRVVEIGDYSRELCGGTHVARSGQLGLVKLLSEASIGSGVRRVEALVGLDAFRYLAREHVLVVPARRAVQGAARGAARAHRRGGRAAARGRAELEKVRARAVLVLAGALADGAEDVGGVALVAAAAPDGVGGNDLRALASDVRGRLGARPGVVALFAADDAGKLSFVVATTAAARDAGSPRASSCRRSRPALGGRGGGKPDLAQGGGTDPAGVAGRDRRAAPGAGEAVTPGTVAGDPCRGRCAPRRGRRTHRRPGARPVRVERRRPVGGGRGARLGVDVGAVRVGVALSDPAGILATPLVTVVATRRRVRPGPLRGARRRARGRRGGRRAAPHARRARGSGGAGAAYVRPARGARRARRADVPSCGRRAPDHRHGHPEARRPRGEGAGAARRHRPGGRRRDPAELAGRAPLTGPGAEGLLPPGYAPASCVATEWTPHPPLTTSARGSVDDETRPDPGPRRSPRAAGGAAAPPRPPSGRPGARGGAPARGRRRWRLVPLPLDRRDAGLPGRRRRGRGGPGARRRHHQPDRRRARP